MTKKVNFNLQFIINNFNNSPFHYFSTPSPVVSSLPPPVVSSQVTSSNGYPNEFQENSTAFFSTENEIMDLLREYYKCRKQHSDGGGGRGAL